MMSELAKARKQLKGKTISRMSSWFCREFSVVPRNVTVRANQTCSEAAEEHLVTKILQLLRFKEILKIKIQTAHRGLKLKSAVRVRVQILHCNSIE